MSLPDQRVNDGRWADLHAHFVAEAKDKEGDVLIIGDDHVALLEQSNFYRDQLAALHCLVFGVIGDTVDLVEWRMKNGEMPRISPKVILLSAGHNDSLNSSPDDFLIKLKSLVSTVEEAQPQSTIFVMKLLPIGRCSTSPTRQWIDTVNGRIESALSSTSASIIDINPTITNSEGVIDPHLLFDFFHLTQEGYNRMFENVHLALYEALNP